MSMSDTCQVLVERYLDGKENALNELVPKIEGIIKSIIRHFHGAAEFEDLYQVGWVAIMKCLQLYDKDSNTKFTSYAYKAIQNEMIIYVTNQNKHKSKYDDDGNCLKGFIPIDSQISNKQFEGTYLTVGDTIEDTSIDMETEIMIELCKPVVDKMIQDIPNKLQKQTLELYMEGVKQKDIADTLEITPAYVSKTIKEFNIRCQRKLNR